MGIAVRRAHLLVCGVALSLSTPAVGQEIDGGLEFNQTFQGAITTHADADLVEFGEAAGSLITIVAAPVGGSKVKPAVELLDQSLAPIDVSGFVKKKGGTFKIVKFPAPYSGKYHLRATSKNGQAGLYRVKVKGKPKSAVSGGGAISAPAELDSFSFSARAGAELSGMIKAKSGDLKPSLVEVVGPGGAIPLIGKVKEKADGAKLVLSGVVLDQLGDYAVRVTGLDGSTGDYDLSLSIDSPKPLKGSVFEDAHPNTPDLDGPSISLLSVHFGRGLREPSGGSMKVVNPLSVVATDPITGLPRLDTLAPLFPGDDLASLIDFHLGPLFQPPVVARNAVLVLRFNNPLDIESLELVDGRLSSKSPIQLTVNGAAIPVEVFAVGKELVLNPVTASQVGFPGSPLAIDGAGNPVASPNGVAALSIRSKGPNVLQSAKGGAYVPRSDGLGSPDAGGVAIGFNPGNALLDFFTQLVAGQEIGFDGFLPDVRAPRLIREHTFDGVYTPNLGSPLFGDQFGPESLNLVLDEAFVTAAGKGLGEWAGAVLRLRPGTPSQEDVIVVQHSATSLGDGLFRNDLLLASAMHAPPAIGDAYQLARAEYFEPDPLQPLEPELYDPLNPQNDANGDLLNFVVIRDRAGASQSPSQPVDSLSTIEVLFDEPMSLESFRPYESLCVTSEDQPNAAGVVTVGAVTLEDAGRRAIYHPARWVQYGPDAGSLESVGFGSVPRQLRFHVKVVPTTSALAGVASQPLVAAFVEQGHKGVTDAGGTPLAHPKSALSFNSLFVDYSFAFATQGDPGLDDYGAIVHRFQGQAKTAFGPDATAGVTYIDVTPDLCGPQGNLYGPTVADVNLFANGFLSGAPVQYFQKIHDDLNPPPTGQLSPFGSGTTTPFGGRAARGGCRFMHVYRAVDASPDWEALAGTILDLRQVAWAPIGGAVTNTALPDLTIHAGHSSIIPDTKQNQGIPQLPDSGLCGPGNSNAMGGHFATLGDVTTDYVEGAYNAVRDDTKEVLRRELVWGSLKPGELADNYQGKSYAIDNANLYTPPGTTRRYHPLPNGDFDRFFAYNNGAADEATFGNNDGFDEAPTWGGMLGDHKPQSLVLEYRVRVVDPEDPPAFQNGFTFAIGILSSALPRFRVFSFGAGCTSCCTTGTPANSGTCQNNCVLAYQEMDGQPGNGNPLEPDRIINAAGPAVNAPGLACYCLQGSITATPPAIDPSCEGISTNGPGIDPNNPSLEQVAYGQVPNPAINNYGDNSRYYMVFNYVKRESWIESPFVRAQPFVIPNATPMSDPVFDSPIFIPPLDEIPVGTQFDPQFRASTNGLGGIADATALLTPEQMADPDNAINQAVGTPYLQFQVRVVADTTTQLIPVIEEIVVPYRARK